jgi:sugar phosphate permease
MPKEKTTDQRDFHRWLVFGIISSVYFLVYFHRVSTSVIAHDLIAAFQTNATALGFMSSMYFYLYALEQPLVGYLSDRLGPRRVVGYWTLIAAFGCVLFGLAPSIGWASVGRALIGFGVGGVYVPAMKAFSQWFQERDFATLTGLLVAVGNVGAVVATTPLAFSAERWGYRMTFFAISGITLGLAMATLFLLRDHNENHESGLLEAPATVKTEDQPLTSAGEVFASVRFWVLAAMFFGCFGTLLTFQGLWATPYLMSVFALERLQASHINMLIPIGFIIGAPVFGRLTDRVFTNRVNVLFTILAVQTLIWACLTYGETLLGLGGIIALLLVMGALGGGFATAIWALVRKSTPDRIVGATMGFLNPAPFLGVAVMQYWTGTILDRTGRIEGMYPAEAFRDANHVCLLVVGACLILCGFFRKRLNRGRR